MGWVATRCVCVCRCQVGVGVRTRFLRMCHDTIHSRNPKSEEKERKKQRGDSGEKRGRERIEEKGEGREKKVSGCSESSESYLPVPGLCPAP